MMQTKFASIAVAALAALVGCSSDPYWEEKQTNDGYALVSKAKFRVTFPAKPRIATAKQGLMEAHVADLRLNNDYYSAVCAVLSENGAKAAQANPQQGVEATKAQLSGTGMQTESTEQVGNAFIIVARGTYPALDNQPSVLRGKLYNGVAGQVCQFLVASMGTELSAAAEKYLSSVMAPPQ